MTTESFSKVVSSITDIGSDWHKADIVYNNIKNIKFMRNNVDNLQELSGLKRNSAVVVSAGPSLHYSNTLETLAGSDYKGNIIAIDGSYVKCLKAGIVPDYMLTLDPHPTRIVRWFGDPDFEENMENDDYFSRQDLDIDFRDNSIRQNQENIELVNKYADQTKLIIASTSPSNVVKRANAAGFDMYWWLPLVDDPDQEGSLTREMYQSSKLPAMNTGGNVGTAAWVFAQFWLNIDKVAVIGMDLGYKKNLPYNMTQTYPELSAMIGDEDLSSDYFPEFKNPLTGEVFYTDPTYFWYRQNILDMISNTDSILYNCTEGGVLFGDNVKCIKLIDFL
ncbi:MAG: DUF115 domain-containing protein [Candidatus Scalindua sp.]|nr:DUF115 domain-containing protein [Candidatus Scalindua sp.]